MPQATVTASRAGSALVARTESSKPLLVERQVGASDAPSEAALAVPATPSPRRTLPNPEAPHEGNRESSFPQPETPRPSLLLLVNPLETGGDIHYALDGKLFTLRPGEYHEISVGTAHEVEFHRGDDLGYSKRLIREGVFVFAVDSTGWSLKLGNGTPELDLRRAH